MSCVTPPVSRVAPASKARSLRRLLSSGDGQIAAQRHRRAVKEGLARDLAVEIAVVQRALEAEAAFGQVLSGQRPLRHVGIEGEVDQPVAALGAAAGSQPAAGAFRHQPQIGKRQIEIEIRRAGSEASVGGHVDLCR